MVFTVKLDEKEASGNPSYRWNEVRREVEATRLAGSLWEMNSTGFNFGTVLCQSRSQWQLVGRRSTLLYVHTGWWWCVGRGAGDGFNWLSIGYSLAHMCSIIFLLLQSKLSDHFLYYFLLTEHTEKTFFSYLYLFIFISVSSMQYRSCLNIKNTVNPM